MMHRPIMRRAALLALFLAPLAGLLVAGWCAATYEASFLVSVPRPSLHWYDANAFRYRIYRELLEGEAVRQRAVEDLRHRGVASLDGERLSVAVLSKHVAMVGYPMELYYRLIVTSRNPQASEEIARALVRALLQTLKEDNDKVQSRFLELARSDLKETDWQDFERRRKRGEFGYEFELPSLPRLDPDHEEVCMEVERPFLRPAIYAALAWTLVGSLAFAWWYAWRGKTAYHSVARGFTLAALFIEPLAALLAAGWYLPRYRARLSIDVPRLDMHGCDADVFRYRVYGEILDGEAVRGHAVEELRRRGMERFDGEPLSVAALAEHVAIVGYPMDLHYELIATSRDQRTSEEFVKAMAYALQLTVRLDNDPIKARFLELARSNLKEAEWQEFKKRHNRGEPGYQLEPHGPRQIVGADPEEVFTEIERPVLRPSIYAAVTWTLVWAATLGWRCFRGRFTSKTTITEGSGTL